MSALGRRRRRFGLFRGLGSPIRVLVDHITHVFRGPHTGHAHTRSRKVTRGLSADRYCSRCRYCCARLVCAGRVLLPLHTCILLRRYHTLLHHHAVTTIAITYICRCWICWIVLGEELCPLLVIQSSQGARGEEFAAEFRSFPASRRLLWGVRSLALPRRSSRAFVRAAVRLYPAGFAQTAPVRSTSWKDPMPPSAYVKAIEELSSPRPAAFFFAVSQAHAGFGRSKL